LISNKETPQRLDGVIVPMEATIDNPKRDPGWLLDDVRFDGEYQPLLASSVLSTTTNAIFFQNSGFFS